MASVHTTHTSATAADATGKTFRPNVISGKSGVFQVTNVSADGSSSVATVVLLGRLTDTHGYHTVKSLAVTSTGSDDTATSAAIVTLFPDMKVTVAETSGNMTATASVLD